MIVLVGESGSGKSRIQSIVCANKGLKKAITYTSRAKRDCEVYGKDYIFLSEEEMRNKIENKEIAEYSIYNGWIYGTPVSECQNDRVIVLTPSGLRQLKKNKDLDIFSVYIDIDRRDRLIKILERGDNIEEAYRRSLSDVGMFDGIKNEVDLVIKNDKYQVSPESIAEIIMKEYESRDKQNA